MNSARSLNVAIVIIGVAFLGGCAEGAKTAWTAVAKDCAVSDINGKNVLFFGPSNVLGPGSVWRVAPPENGGGYRARWDSTALPQEPKWSQGGGEFTCQGGKKTKFSGGATATFAANLAPLSADARADFSRAKDVEVKASMMKWDFILEGPFEQVIVGLPASSPIKQDLANPGRLVLYRALKVSGFEAKLLFDNSTGGELQAKYKDGALKSINGDLGAGLNFKWTSANELVIAAPSDFYIAGELVKYTAGGFAAGTKSPFSPPVEIPAGAKLDVDKVN